MHLNVLVSVHVYAHVCNCRIAPLKSQFGKFFDFKDSVSMRCWLVIFYTYIYSVEWY